MHSTKKHRKHKRFWVRNIGCESLEKRNLLAGDLIAHWTASESISVGAEGAVVASWTDIVSGKQSETVGTPMLVSDAIGGRAAVRFDATDGVDGIRISSFENPLDGATDFSVAVVVAGDSNALHGNTGPWFENTGIVDSSALGLSSDWGITMAATGQISAGVGAGFLSPPSTIYSSQTGLNDGDFHLVVFTRNGSTIGLSIDGAALETQEGADTKPRAPLDLVFGMIQTEGQGYTGDIGEVRIFDGALDANEITSLHAEVSNRYANQPPVTNDDAYTLDEDQFFFVTAADGLLANDFDNENDALTAVLLADAEHGEVSVRENGGFVYSPPIDFFGTDRFLYTANDFRPGNVGVVTLEVMPQYDPAVAVSDFYAAQVGERFRVSAAEGVLQNDSNPDQSEVSIELTQDVLNGSLTLNQDGSFEYDSGDFAGTTSFMYRLNDGTTQTAPATVSIRVNSAPEANGDDYSVNEDSTLVVNRANGILSNDIDNEGDALTINLVTTTANGTLTLADDGSFTYVPTENYSGSDRFSYSLSDGKDESQIATVQIRVEQVNDAPVGVSDSYVLDSGVSLMVSADEGVLANDSDIDGPVLTAILNDQASRGTVTLNADGSFTYETESAFLGFDSFRYTVSDLIETRGPITVDILFDTPRGNTDPTGDSIVTFNEIMYNPAGIDDGLEWIELRNQMGIDMDISGWRLDGAISFDFVEGTVIPGNSYLVIAADPEQLKNTTGFDAAIGPFVGRLNNAGEEIQLRNNSNRVLDILQYNDREDWPVAPDGSGATLSKIYVHTASGEAENWSFSSNIGGTPGATNTTPTESTVVFNEIQSVDAAEFAVELSNVSDRVIDLSQFQIVSSESAHSPKILSGQLAPQELVSFDENDLGFDAADEDRLFLMSVDGTIVHDAQVATDRLRGRWSDGKSDWLFPTTATFGSPNQFQVNDDIVINEIMYHSAGTYLEELSRYFESNQEWVELYNRGDQEVDLSDWSFNRGIRFEFAEGTKIGPGEYLVVANDVLGFLATYPNLSEQDVVGPYDGALANGGERLQLVDGNKNPVDHVRYYDGGRWPEYADGRGSSLELRDPHADNNLPESWAASNGGLSSEWQTVTYSGRGRNNGNDPTRYHEFLLGLLDGGEVLIDDVSVVQNPGENDATQLIQNGSFDADAIGSSPDHWRVIGTQHGTVVADPTDPSNQVLHLRATGPTEHMHNNAGTTLKDGDRFHTIRGTSTYEISFRAKWIGGSNQLNSRLYFNRLPKTTRIQRPRSVGTPGEQNSTLESNIGPNFQDLSHFPIVPDAGQPTTITVSANDVHGVDSVELFYSVNDGPFQRIAMALTENGQFAAEIPGQSASRAVQFYVEGQDGMGSTSTYPAAGPDSSAIYRVQDDRGFESPLHNLRIIMTPDDANRLHTTTNVMSNHRIGATVIYKESEVFYDVGVRLKGSQRGRDKQVRAGFNVQFNPDQLFRGVHETIGVDRSGAGDEYSQKEIIVRQIINHAGDMPQIYDDLIWVVAPQSRHTGTAMLNMARYNDVFLDSMYENGSQGTAFEYELIYFPTTTTGGVEGLKRPNPDNVVGQPLRDLGDDPELYRWHYLIKNNRIHDDYSQIMDALNVIGMSSSSAGFRSRIEEVLDVDQWLRSFAVQVISGIGDNYANGSQHNGIFYARPDGKTLFLPWDMDFSFSQSTSSGLVNNGDLRKLISTPANERAYYGHVHDILQTTFNPGYMDRWVDHFNDLVPRQNYNGFKSYISRRFESLERTLSRVIDVVPFEIEAAGPLDVGASPTATLTGTGWVDVRTIWLAGGDSPLEITWTDENHWRTSIPVDSGSNEYSLLAYDFQGELIGENIISITSTIETPARDSLRISEIHFNPAPALDNEVDTDKDDFEFIELVNIGTAPINLEGVQFIRVDVDGENEGIEYTFPDRSLSPNERIVVVKDAAAFASRYGDLPQMGTGVFSGRLSNGGETITLIDANGGTIQQLVYDDAWYPETDGEGASLELLNPADPDLENWNLAESWRASRQSGGTPGRGNDSPGDANRDGVFDSSDLVLVSQAGEFEDDIDGNSTWEEGDWDGDGDFTTGDLILAFNFGNYRSEAVAALAASADRSRHANTIDAIFDVANRRRQQSAGNPTDDMITAKAHDLNRVPFESLFPGKTATKEMKLHEFDESSSDELFEI